MGIDMVHIVAKNPTNKCSVMFSNKDADHA
jgi:hypothetical protein